MTTVYVFDANLAPLGMIESFKSLIWAKRYTQLGDCELYTEASPINLEILRPGNFLVRTDDDMVCLIDKVEVTTSVTDGDYITATGSDARILFDKRVMGMQVAWNDSAAGLAEWLLEHADQADVMPNAGKVSLPRPFIKPNGTALFAEHSQTLPASDKVSKQIGFGSVGESVRGILTEAALGYRVGMTRAGASPQLTYEIYAGQDHRDEVIFSEKLDNLAESSTVRNTQKVRNVAIVAGAGEGADRIAITIGCKALSTDALKATRSEIYIDARDVARVTTYGALLQAFPAGSGAGQSYIIDDDPEQGFYSFAVHQLRLPLPDLDIEELVQENPTWDWNVVTVDGQRYVDVGDVAIANFGENEPTSDAVQAELVPAYYYFLLQSRGIEKLAAYVEVDDANGTIIPGVTFTYREDFDIGDIVSIRDPFGVRQVVRISEIVESFDESGSTIEPKFEKLEVAT